MEKHNIAKIFWIWDFHSHSLNSLLFIQKKAKMSNLITVNKHKLNSPKMHRACKN